MGNKQGHELSPEEKQRLKEEKRLLKEDKEHKKRLRKIEQRRLKDEKRKGTTGSSSAAATPATVKKDTEDAQSVGGSSVWSEKSVGSAPESWYHSASEPGSKRSSIYLPASAGPGYYQHDCWYSGYEDSGSEKSKPTSRAGSRPGSRPPSRAPSVKDTLNLRSSSLERYPLGVPTGEAIEPMHKAGSLDLANVVATNFLENREQLAGELEIAAAIASRYDETIRASKEQLEKTSVDKASLIDRASLTDKVSLTSSVYHSAEEGSTRGEKRKVHLEDRESLSSVYYSADEASIGSKRKVLDYGSDHTSATGSIYYSADEGGSVAGSVYYTATSGSEVEDHVTDAEILGKDRPSPPSKPVAVDREGSALSRLAYIKVENDALLLHWEAPESDGGTPISGYILERCEGDGDFWVRVNLVPIKDTEYAVANLIGGREYRFRVSAENAVGVSDPSERSEMVSISTDQEATEPHFLKELRDVTAVEGHRVEFIVDIIGTPPPDVSWYKDGFEIFDTKRFEFIADGDRYSLVLKEAKISDAGDIRVRATNRVGVASSQAVLHIQAPPRITLPPQYEQGLIFDTDELIRLRVPYTGRPPPLATWAHNGKEIEADDRHTMDVSEKYITLKIAGANRADKGMYSLNLANPQGIDNVSFFVTVTDRPDPPSMPVVTDITGQSVTLRWDPPQDDGGCRISNYIVEYFRMGWDVWLKGASSRITWTQLSELIVGSEYRFRVKAENAYGVSDPGEECEPVLIDETKSPSGSFEYETYKSTTAVGSSLPRDSATLIKEEGSSFEYGSSDIGSEGATDSVEKAKLQGMGASDEIESSLDLGSSSEKGASLDYGGSMERGASYELGASMERGASYELGASMERGASYELGASMERGDSYELGASMERGASYDLGSSLERGASYELGSSIERGASYEFESSLERGPSFEVGSSMERGSSFESDAAKGRYQSGRLSSSAEQGTSETSLGVPGSRDGVQKTGYSYEVSGSMERGDSYDQERLLGTGEFTELGGSAGGSIELSGSPGESMDIGGSMDSEEPPMPPPRVPRRGGRSPALPPSVGSGWSPTPARRKRRQKSAEVSGGGDQSMEYEEEGTEETPTLPYRRRRPGSQSSLVSSEAPLGEETTSSGWVTETTAATSTTAEFESGQAAPDSTPSLATTDTSLTARMEAVTVAAGGEAVLVVSLENIQVAKISWQKGGREIVPGPHYTTTETQKAAQLIIHGATTNDTGTYTALVTKPDGSQARAAVALQVASLSVPTKIEAPTFVRSLSDLAAKVGTRVRFLVELRQAHDVKVYWYHNNVEVVEDPRFRILHEGNFFCVDISPLTVDDEGPWRCLAENSYGQASSNASLRVIVPKGYKKPIFLEELEAILTAEGTVSLECKVVGVPTPVLRWFKDGNEIKAGDVFALTANPEDPTSLGTYTCEAVNCMGRALSSSRVRVVSRESSLRPPSRKSRRSPTPIGPPPKLVEELVDKRVKVGEKGRMIVKVETPPEVLSVTWYNNGKKIEASEKYRLSDEGGGKFMIEITPTELGDDGEWKAVVRTEGGYSSSTCKLTLTVPRNYRGPRFLDDLRAVLTEEGLVSFECKVVGYPTPVLQWFKDGQELKPGDVYQLSGTNSLGKYSCIAKNCMGEAQSSAELTIEDIKSHLNEEEKEQLLATNVPPRFIQGLKSRDIKIGDSVRLTVQVTMTPTPEITWYHEDEVVVESKNYHISKADGGLFHLDISSLDLLEQGEWKCLASNDFGHSVTAASIKLVIPRHYKKPVFLEPLRAVLSYEGTVNLECKVIGVPQPVLKWFKDGTELKPGDIHRIISGEDGTCCLGTYTCEAINVMGSASSSAALLGFEDKLLQKEGDKISMADARGIARNPSLSTINEERSSQISVYESAISEADGEKADVSVSIDGREVSLSLYETPDISEAEAKQIAEIYAEEISDHLSAHESNQAELPPLRFTRETSRKGPLIMEAMVIDVEDQAFDEYISMADVVYDDARTEADVEELSAMEAVVVEEREALCSDIADLPEMEVWGEEHVSARSVSMEAKGVAHISERQVLQHDLRTLSEQGLSLLKTHAQELPVGGRQAAIAEEALVMSAGPKTMASEKVHQAVAEGGAAPGLNVAQAQEQAVFTSAGQIKGEKVEKAKGKRSIETGQVAQAEQQQFLSDADTLSDVTNISKVLERYPSFIPHEAMEVNQQETVEQAKPLDSEERPSKKVKRASVKKSQVEGQAATVQSPEIYEGEAKLPSEGGIKPERATAIPPGFEGYNVMSTEVLEDVASLEAQGMVAQHARVKDASQREALVMGQADVVSESAKSMKLKKPQSQKAEMGQVTAAGVAQQQEQSFYTATQDIPESFPAEETEADFSELHSMLEPMQSSERYAYEHAESMKAFTPEQQMAMQLDPSYREALAVSVKEGFSQASELTLASGQHTQAYAHQTLHEAVEGYEQIGISGDIREIPAYAQGKSDRANFMTEAAKEAVMVQEADVDYANLNVFNREDMSHMLTVAEERSGSLAECIVVQEADLQSEAAIVSQRPAVKPERAVAGIVEGAAESATVGEPPLIAGMAGEKVDSLDKKRPASEIGEDEKKISASERKSVKIESLTDESAAKRAKVEEEEAIEEMGLATTTLTQEEIQAKKEELRAKLQNLRARKEEGLLDSPSSDSYSESLESDEARGIKVTDKARSAAAKKDTLAAEGEQMVEEDLSGDEVECTGKSIKRRLSEKLSAFKKGPSVEKTLEDGSTSPKADSSQEKTGFLKRVPSFKKGPSVEKTTSEDGATSPTRGSSQERTGLLKRIPSFKKGPSAEKTTEDGTASPQRGASQEKTGLFSSLKRVPSSEKTSEKTSEDGTMSPKREPSQEKTGLFSSLKRAPSSEKTSEKTSEDGTMSPKREPSQEKTGLFSRKRAPSGEKTSEDGTTSPKREPSQEKTGLFSAFKRGPSTEKSIPQKQELPQEKTDLQLETSEKPSEDGTTTTKRASSQEKIGIFKKAPSAEKSLSPTKDQAQEKSISPPESPTAPKDTSEKDDVSQEKDTSEGKKKGLFAGMKSAISSKVTEMKTAISPGKSTAKSEDVEVIEGTADSLQDREKAQVASAEVTLQGDKDIISKDQVKATEVTTVIAADSKEGLIVNGQKTSLGDSVSAAQEAAAAMIEGQIAQLAEQQAKEIAEGAVQGASVLDALAAKREEILARKQELLARQEAAMKGRGESEEPSSELTSTSDISSGSAGDMESVLETKKGTIAGSTVDAFGKDTTKIEEEKKLIAKTEIYEESSVTADASLSLKKKGKSGEGTETSVGLTISMKGDEESKKLIDSEISKKGIELKEAQLKEVSGAEAIEDIKIKADKVAEAKSTVVGSELHEASVSDTEKTMFGKAKSPESKTETKAKDTKDESKKSKSPEPKLVSKDAKKAKSPELKTVAKDKESKTALVSGTPGETEGKDATKAKSPEPKDKVDDKKEIETKAPEPKVKAEDKKDAKAKSPEPKEKMGDIKEEKAKYESKDKIDSKTEARAKSPEAKGKLDKDKDESKKAKSPEPKSVDKGKEEVTTTVPTGSGVEIKDKDEKKAKSPEPKDKAEDKKGAKTKSPEPKGKEEDKKDAKAKSPELKGIGKDKKDAKAKSPEQKSEVEDKKDTKAKSPEPKGKVEDKMDAKAKSSESKSKEEDKKDAKIQSLEDKGKLDTDKEETKKAKSAEQKDAEKGKEETKTTVSTGTAAEIKDKEGAKKAKSPEPKTKMDDKKDTKTISPEPEGKVEDKKDKKGVSPGQKDKVEDTKETKAKSPEAKTKAEDKKDSKAMSPESKQKLDEQKDASESKTEVKLKEDEKKVKPSETKVDTKEASKKAKSPEPKAESKEAKKAKSPEPKAEDKGITKGEVTDKESDKRDLGKAKTPESKTGVGVSDVTKKDTTTKDEVNKAEEVGKDSKVPKDKEADKIKKEAETTSKVTDKESDKRDLGKAKTPESKTGVGVSDVTKKDTTTKDEVSKPEEVVKDSKVPKDQEVDQIKKEAETTSKQDANKAKSPDEDKKKVTEKPGKKEDKDAPATATTVADKAKSPDVSEKKRSDIKEDQKETKDEEKIKEKPKKAKTPDSSEKKRRSKSREKDVDSAKQVDGGTEFKEKERKSKSKSPGPKLRKKSSIKEADVKAAEEGVEKPTRLRKRSSTKEDDSDVSAADKAKSPEVTLRRRSSQKKEKHRSKSPEALERKRSSLLDDREDDSLALRGAELRQQEEVLRTARRDEGKRYSQEKMMKEDEELLRLQEEEKAKRQSEMRREEIERLNREEKEIAERRKKRKEEEDKRRLEELDRMKKEEQEKAEQRKKEWEAKEKKRKEEQEREEKEEQERRKRLEMKREEIERMKKEEEAKLQKEEAERNERRKQRRLEEEKALKEQEEKYFKQEQERRERRRKLKEDEEKQMREREEERRKKEEQEQEEKRQKKLKEREEEERLMKEEEERRKERRRKREEQDKLFAKEEAIQEEERRRRVEKDKRRLEDELRKKDEEKRQKEEELRLQGEEFLKKEEERRRRRLEERRRKDEEEEKEYRRMVEESEERRRQERAKRQIEYSEKELISVERYSSVARRSLPSTPDLEANRRRDPRRRPKFSTKLQDRQIAKGTRVRLSCNVLSALDDEAPEVEWFKGGYPIKEDDRIKVVNYEGVASLEINHSCRGDSGEYTCTAKNRHGRVSTTCDLRVKGDEDQRPTPPTFTTSLRERYVTEDDELVLSCHVMGFPQPKITWLKDADKLPASPRFQTSITEDGICKLIVTSPRSADSGTYTCHAENRVYRDEISANIQVQNLIDKERQREGTADDSEVPRFVSELCDQYVEENGTLTLQVEVAGSPPPDVLWLFNGRSLHPSGKFRISAAGNTHTLTVFQVTQKDIGTYSCRITNRYGHAYTLSSVYFGTPKPRKGITVPGADMEMRAPTFKERPESMVSVYKDEEIQLSCTVVGEPTPRVTWLKGGHDVSITTRATKSVKDNHHTLVIRGASFTDSGTYTVEAKNSHGTVRAYCSVKVRETYRSRSFSPRGQDEMYVTTSYEEHQRRTTGRFIRDVPGKVGTPKAHDIGKNWVSLQWTRPEHTGGVMVTAYKVESWILGEEARWQDLGVTPIPSFDVYHLKQDREYLFRVTPRNKYGWGEPVMTPRPIRIGRKIEHPTFPRCLPHQVRAMPGGCISLDAQVTGEPMPEIRWYKDGTLVDVERYPRFSSHCSEGSVSLRIQDLQWEDEGKYELEVLNPGGRVTSYTRVNTTNDCSILEAQERINNNLMALSRLDTVPSMAPQFTMRLRDRRVQVGFPVRLTCQIVGVPRPTVSWFKNGESLVIDDCHTTWQEDGHFYTLEISNSTHDDAAIYSACASNPYGSVLCKCRLIVDSGLKSYISPMFLRELEDQSVRQGETITLQTVIEAYPTIGVVWHRDGQRIRISRKHSFSLDADGIASLVIRKADYTDGGLYTCTASNEMGHIESICRVSVSCTDSDLASGRRKIPKIWYSNEPIFVRKPRAIDAEEGDLVIIECEVMGEPKPTVSWLRDWLEPSVYSDGDRFQEIGTGPVYRLEIPNCRLEDTGAYSILAKNDHGETRAVVSVQVYAKGLKGELEGTPVKRGVMEFLPVVTRPLQDVRCCDGDSVTLEALVEAPKSSIVRWEKQGKVLKLGGDIESEWDGSRVRLKIREVYPEDEGEYSCIIFNDMGKAVTSATLIVEMADDKENDVTVQMEHRPDLSRRTTPSRTNTPSRWSRSPSVNFQREGSAHSWAGVGWREPSVSVPHWRPLSRGSSPLLLARRFTPEPSTRSKSRSHRPKFYYIPHDRIVEEGETVTFQCAVKGNPVPRASWDKDNMKIVEGGRIKFEERDEVRTLEIPKVTQQDAGLYRVTIENELGREQATARLDVIKSSGNKYAGYVRAWNTSPLTAPQFARRMPSTPVSEGSRLTLRADYRGSPLPRAKWYRNGELLPLCDDFPQTYNGRQAVLEIPEVTTGDAGTYSCVLENDVGKTECSCEVIVEHRNEVENTPPYFIQGLKDLTVLDGDEIRLTIRVGGSLPLKVVWVRNDLEIKPSKDFRYEEEGNGCYSLFLRDIYPDDAGIYICEAYNMHGEAHSYCKMTVHDPRAAKSSAPCIVGNLTPLVVEEGSAARFTVAVHGHPTPTLSWFLDGRKLMSTPRIKVEVDEDVGPDEGHQHTLSIVHALSTDSGVLSVVASNCLGTDSASTTLKVNLYAPNREDRFKSSANNSSSVSTNAQSRLTPPRTSNSPAPRIKPMLKEISNTGTGSVDSAYGSSSLRDSSGCSSSLSNVSELEYDAITKEQHQHEMSQKHLQTVESHKEEEEEEEEEAGQDLDEEDEELAVGCEADSDEVGAEIISGPVDVTVLKGQSATLTATYTGKPEPLVSWLKKEQEICDGGRYSVKTENGTTTLIIHDIVQEDCDKYTVVVRNSLGAHAAFASLAVGSAPEPPADKPNHSEVTADSVTLSWYGPTYDGGSVVTGYIVEAHKIGNGDWFTLISGCHSTSYIAQGLDTNCQYEFRVRAQNIHGVSEPSKPSIPVTTSAPPDKDDEPEPEDHETAFAPLNVEIEAGANFDKQYKMHEEVGKGRFGIVYRVTDTQSGTRRAAKVIKCIKSTEKEKVREEISIMNALRHPKLLQLGAAYERPREIIMVMEYISGGELFERVVADDFALTERDCILFVRQICEGVAYMHKSHIVHLDLKPENILCVRRTSHQIKLIDFGLARRFNPDDPCRVLFGTPEFIAPEIINYELIGFSSDMWSVGVICYVLLSGLSPFMGDNDAETFANITRAEFDFDDDAFTAITEDAKDFIRSLLIKKKEKRLTAEQCFDHPWLAQTEEDMNKVVLSTDKLKKFIIRRKWQKTGNAIRALGRMANLTNRRSSQPSSPTRLSPLPENHAHTPTSPSTPPPTNSPGLNSLAKTKGCPPVTRSSGSVISERSDSGISECSFSVDDNTQNPQNNQFGLTNGRAVTGRNILQSGKTPSLDWQSSVDSAVCDDDYISKSGFGSSQRKISREALLVKSAAADSMINAHSRI